MCAAAGFLNDFVWSVLPACNVCNEQEGQTLIMKVKAFNLVISRINARDSLRAFTEKSGYSVLKACRLDVSKQHVAL